jgi:hypothetical protein
MHTHTPSETVLRACHRYAKRYEFPWSRKNGEAVIKLSFGFYSTRDLYIRTTDEEVHLMVHIAKSVPRGFVRSALMLQHASGNRIYLDDDGAILWHVCCDHDDLSTRAQVEAATAWVMREAFVAESLLLLYAKEGRHLSSASVLGLGETSEFEDTLQ